MGKPRKPLPCSAQQELHRLLHQRGLRNGKGVLKPEIRRYNLNTKTVAVPRQTMQAAKLSRKLSRLYEFQRVFKKPINNDWHSLQYCSAQVKTLYCKLWPTARYYSLGTLLCNIALEISEIKADCLHLEDQGRKERLATWREACREPSIKQAASWLRAKDANHVSVHVARNQEVALTDAQVCKHRFEQRQ